jgi:hypothetical protein
MSIFTKITSFLSGGFMKEARGILDDVITNKEELAEAHLKLTALETSTMIKMKEMQIEDTKSAREADVERQKSPNASWLAKNTAYIIALGVSIGAVTTWFVEVSERADTSANAAFMLVLGFFFGSAVNEYNKKFNKAHK